MGNFFEIGKNIFGNKASYYLVVCWGVVFYSTYWISQVGLQVFLIVILPQPATLYQVLLASVVFFVFLPLLYIVAYYFEIIFFFTVHNFSKKDKAVTYIGRAIIPVSFIVFIIFTSLIALVIFCLALLLGEIIQRRTKIVINQTLLKINGKINYTIIVIAFVMSFFMACSYADYVKKLDKKIYFSTTNTSKASDSFHYLGIVADKFVLQQDSNILLVSEIQLKRK